MADLDQILSNLDTRLARLEAESREIRNLIGPFGALLPDGNMLVQTVHRIKLIIDPLDVVMAPSLILERQWEPDITALILNSIDKNTVFCDVGANIGYHTCLAGIHIGRAGTGRIFAMEPNPNCFELLQRNLEINWSMCPIDARQIAVANFQGRAKLAVPKLHAANAHLEMALSESDPDAVDTPVERLDDVVPDHLAVDILKIDVEGHEFAVLDGARALIARSPNIKIVLEWSHWQMEAAKYGAGEVLDLFQQLGFVPYRVPTSLSSIPDRSAYSRQELTDTEYTNLVLARRR